jgi:sulfite exporter TauE/SafE
MQTTLAVTALFMGLAGGPHCVAMCGAGCAAIGRSGDGRNTRSMWAFQLGRVAGYSVMGAMAAASMQGVGWLSVHSAALRPIWSLLHVAAAFLGVMLLWQARQPVWLEDVGRTVWKRVRAATGGSGGRPGAGALVLGVAWSLLPCGLLYSALLVAALSRSMAEGAVVMALFALGSSLSLMAGPWLWVRLRAQSSGQWAIRLAGLALLATSLFALWMGLVHNTAPWCLTP